ncbi:hypothetical protein BDEG_27992 [Batrachochytrium dendrobatidis JEL423]|uniref:Anaphase-promoting complex subunit 11 RING-H2 finger domain-containing protein n=1 Tax=Batrachochytrium dendrobatidis (strain JEL423) TaxID=403673 RepID=A0A177WXI4_BATDL|nr:hypothetical protein BDEG_27992 [Batrachochytrium dendrobatidis JEL423]
MTARQEHWRSVAEWRWAVVPDDDDVCAICMNPYESCCPKCKLPGDDCPLGKSDYL